MRTNYVAKYCKCINKNDMLHPEFRHGVCRYNQLSVLIQDLISKKRIPLLLGEKGVGKTDLLEALADKMNTNEITAQLQDSQIWCVDWSKIQSLNDFKHVVNECKHDERLILAVDCRTKQQMHWLNAELSPQKIRCILVATPTEYYSVIDGYPLENKIDEVYFTKPDVTQMSKILQMNLVPYRNRYHISMSVPAFKDILVLTGDINLEDKKMYYNPNTVFSVVNKVFTKAKHLHRRTCTLKDIKASV